MHIIAEKSEPSFHSCYKDMKMILIGEFEFKLDVHAVYNFVIYIQTRNYVFLFFFDAYLNFL